jgi:hypothetical protein
VGKLLFVNNIICVTVEDPIIDWGRVGITLFSLTPPHFCACPKPGCGFSKLYIVVGFFKILSMNSR